LLKKKEELKILESKFKRIEYRVSAMNKYEKYLLNVKAHNPDEYVELADILSRYTTLKTSNMKLNQ